MMQPLVSNARGQSTKSSSIWCKSLCILAAIISVILISLLAYFGTGSNLNAQSPAKNLVKKHDSSTKKNTISLPTNEYDSFYPTQVDVDPNRIIIKSDTSKTSDYYNSNAAEDLIKSMPGLVESTCSESPSNCKMKQYSGYLLANNQREIHYWFIQAETNPHKAPVFIWTNGGPGCSGMDGLLTEHGPWKVLKNNQIGYNQYAWTTEVNMVYLEQPYGVGFSTPAEGDDVVGGDQNAADDMDAAIRDFINKFPKFADNDFYLSSESWGGHYVPMTSYTILQNNDNGVEPHINFKGFLLGNPSTDPYENKYGFVGGIWGHGLLKSSDWNTWRDECWGNADAIDSNSICSAIHTRAYYSAFNANVYGLDYPQCPQDEQWYNNQGVYSDAFMQDAHIHRAAQKSMKKVLESKDFESLNMNSIKKEDLQILYDKIESRLSAKFPIKSVLNAHDNEMKKLEDDTAADSIESDNYLPCIEHYMSSWLNQEEVQQALNVKPTSWNMCSDRVWNAWPDSDFERHIEPFYTRIVDDYVDKLGLTLCVYSGDDDSVCGLEGTMYWLQRWGKDVNSDTEWDQWSDDTSQLAGYYTQYLTDSGSVGLHFLTVRSAGHMVPTTQPLRALNLLKKYLYQFRDSDSN